ncbi:MAG: hypothetical protein ABID38_00735 [Candidatus Diapherotrites archaeon]
MGKARKFKLRATPFGKKEIPERRELSKISQDTISEMPENRSLIGVADDLYDNRGIEFRGKKKGFLAKLTALLTERGEIRKRKLRKGYTIRKEVIKE